MQLLNYACSLAGKSHCFWLLKFIAWYSWLRATISFEDQIKLVNLSIVLLSVSILCKIYLHDPNLRMQCLFNSIWSAVKDIQACSSLALLIYFEFVKWVDCFWNTCKEIINTMRKSLFFYKYFLNCMYSKYFKSQCESLCVPQSVLQKNK